MKPRLILFSFMAFVVALSAAQARELFMAPLKDGRVSTRDGMTAAFVLQGQAAQGLFEKMPASSIIPADKSCAPEEVTKIVGGLICVGSPKDRNPAYECKMLLDYNTGTLFDYQKFGSECDEDSEVIEKARKQAKKQGYWRKSEPDEQRSESAPNRFRGDRDLEVVP